MTAQHDQIIRDYLSLVPSGRYTVGEGPVFETRFEMMNHVQFGDVKYDPVRFDEANRCALGPVVDDTLLCAIAAKPMKNGSLMFYLDGIARCYSQFWQRRLYAARGPNGNLVVAQSAASLRERIKPREEPPQDDPTPDETDDDPLDLAALSMGMS